MHNNLARKIKRINKKSVCPKDIYGHIKVFVFGDIWVFVWRDCLFKEHCSCSFAFFEAKLLRLWNLNNLRASTHWSKDACVPWDFLIWGELPLTDMSLRDVFIAWYQFGDCVNGGSIKICYWVFINRVFTKFGYMFWTCELKIDIIWGFPFVKAIRVVWFEFIFACKANTRLYILSNTIQAANNLLRKVRESPLRGFFHSWREIILHIFINCILQTDVLIRY